MDQVCSPLEASDLSAVCGAAATGSPPAAAQQLVVCFALGPAGPAELWQRLRRPTRRVVAVLLTGVLAQLAARRSLSDAQWPWAACEVRGQWTEQLVAGACAGTPAMLPPLRRLPSLAADARRCFLLDALRLARPLGRDGSAALSAEVSRETKAPTDALPHTTDAAAARSLLEQWVAAHSHHPKRVGEEALCDRWPAPVAPRCGATPRPGTPLQAAASGFELVPGISQLPSKRPMQPSWPLVAGTAAWDRIASSGDLDAASAAASAASCSRALPSELGLASAAVQRPTARLIADQLGVDVSPAKD